MLFSSPKDVHCTLSSRYVYISSIARFISVSLPLSSLLLIFTIGIWKVHGEKALPHRKAHACQVTGTHYTHSDSTDPKHIQSPPGKANALKYLFLLPAVPSAIDPLPRAHPLVAARVAETVGRLPGHPLEAVHEQRARQGQPAGGRRPPQRSHTAAPTHGRGKLTGDRYTIFYQLIMVAAFILYLSNLLFLSWRIKTSSSGHLPQGRVERPDRLGTMLADAVCLRRAPLRRLLCALSIHLRRQGWKLQPQRVPGKRCKLLQVCRFTTNNLFYRQMAAPEWDAIDLLPLLESLGLCTQVFACVTHRYRGLF